MPHILGVLLASGLSTTQKSRVMEILSFLVGKVNHICSRVLPLVSFTKNQIKKIEIAAEVAYKP